MSSRFLESRASTHVTVAWEYKCHNHEGTPLFPLPFAELLLLSTKSYGVEYTFGQFGSALLAGSPPSLLPTYSLLTVTGRERESLDTLQVLFSNSQNIVVLSMLLAGQL